MKPTKRMLKERKLTKKQQELWNDGFQAGLEAGKRQGRKEIQDKIKESLGIFEF